mgnify:CR=1 FL=1|jgi:SUF system FeS assembly protein, NifU family
MPTSIELTPQIMREIIMDHYSNPRHKHAPDGGGYISTHSASTNCIDDIDVFLKEKDGVVVDAVWTGVACAISTASTDILCDLVIGKNTANALKIIAEYNHMIHEEPYDSSVLDEALAFMNTSKQAARIHCATIGWDAMEKLLISEEKK